MAPLEEIEGAAIRVNTALNSTIRSNAREN